MSGTGTPAIGRGRSRAQTAKFALPLAESSSPAHIPPSSNAQNFESYFQYPLRPFKNNPRNCQSTHVTGMSRSQQFLSAVAEGGAQKVLSKSSIFQAYATLPLPPRRPPPINPKLRILKTAKLHSRKADVYQDNPTHSPLDRKSPLLLKLRKMTTDFPKQVSYTKRASTTTPACIESAQEVGKTAAKSGNDDGERTPDMRRLKENEEKMQLSSESLHMDHEGLKQFPILGPNDRHVRLLSLQHNSISRLQNLVVLSQLIVLDLYCNKIERISGLQSFHSLRVLLLGKNRIRRMEGLDGLRRLEILDLHGNQLRYLDNLNSLESLRIINVAGNVIRSIRNFGPSGLLSLVELNLKRNRLRNLNGLEKAPNLKKLLISNNELQNISSLDPLQKLKSLEELLLESNPFCSIPEYTNQILSLFPSLVNFDRVSINEEMRKDARNWQRLRSLPRDSAKSQAHVEVSTVSSRDEVIQQAQRRWESVKDYVKKKPSHRRNYGMNSRARQISNDCHRSTSEPRNTKQTETRFEPLGGGASGRGTHSEVTPDTSEKQSQKEMIAGSSSKWELDNSQVAADSKSEETASIPFEYSLSPKLAKVAIVRPRIRKESQSLMPGAGTGIQNNQLNNVSVENTELSALHPALHESSRPILVSERARSSTLERKENEDSIHSLHPVVAQDFDFSGQVEPTSVEWKPPPLLRSSSSSSIHPGDCVAPARNPRSKSSCNVNTSPSESKAREMDNKSQIWRTDDTRVPWSGKLLRSSSVDTPFQNSNESSVTNITEMTVPVRRRASASVYRHIVPRRSKQRGQTAKASSSGHFQFQAPSPRFSTIHRPMTGIREKDPVPPGKPLKRVNSLSTIGSVIRETVKKQGSDYLMEVDGKTLSLYGQGALKHFLTWFPEEVAESVDSIEFNFITYESILLHFEKLRQTYASAEHFHFRANNISVLAQINNLADLQGLTSIHINPEGNPITGNPLWESYVGYRLAHWGLKQINGKEVASDYHGGGFKLNNESKVFESLGYLALSCLPQTTLTPLATKLHSLQTFCCCSQSSSSEDSGRKKADSDSSDSICTSWDNDPVLLDVIGKEALVYNPPKNEASGVSSAEIASVIVKEGSMMLKKLDKLDKSLHDILQRAIEDILIDYICLDNFMKKELKKVKDACLMNKKL